MKKKINPNKIKTRDGLMVKIIQGVTKANIVPDKKKQKSKDACRKSNWD